jgi:dimethylhistidine N-methyltransferase
MSGQSLASKKLNMESLYESQNDSDSGYDSNSNSNSNSNDDYDLDFANDVKVGLSLKQKRLSSKYFYNDAGSHLFDQITQQPEYYLTRAESDIIRRSGVDFFERIGSTPFNLFELGCGNGDKTFDLLESILNVGQHFSFYPMDISQVAIDGLVTHLHKTFPLLKVKGLQGDYHQFLANIKLIGEPQKNVVLFLGSNIGNYSKTEASQLLTSLHQGLNSGDQLLIGMDLKKDIQRMTAAYNDQNGVTKAFNLNLLHRMNDELGANFELDSFSHYETYNPLDAAMQSFLVSAKTQTIQFSAIDLEVEFDAYETIFVESSHKYSLRDVEGLASENGFKVLENFVDDKGDFVDSLWQRM